MKFWQVFALVALCCATVLGSAFILATSDDGPRFEMREFDGVMVRLDRETGEMATCMLPDNAEPRCYQSDWIYSDPNNTAEPTKASTPAKLTD